MITLAIVDDNLVQALALQSMIDNYDNCKMLTVQYNGFAFIEYCSKHQKLPDIAIVDVKMPVMDGVALTDFLTQYYPTIKVIGLSSYTHQEVVEDMLACGAKGYVCKIPATHWQPRYDGEKYFHLQEAIEAVAAGKYYIDTHIHLCNEYENHVFDISALVAKRTAERLLARQVGFTDREIKSSNLYATSTASQPEIAKVLSLANKTVEKQLQAASGKLATKTRHAFALSSIACGLVKIARGFRLG